MSRSREDRIVKKSKEKELISLWKRKMKLYDAKRNLNLVELENPIRSGYKKFFVLREDFARSDESSVYLGILPYIQKTVYCRNDRFLSKEFKTKKWIDIPHDLKTISHKKWNEISPNLTEKQKRMFQIFWKQTDPKNTKIGGWEYRLIKQHMFVPKVEPHYKTHSVILDPDIESEIREIGNKIERNNLMPKLIKSLGWSNGYKYWYDNRRSSIIEKVYANESNNILEYDQYTDRNFDSNI